MPHHHSIPAIADTNGRYDMYSNVHKALRKAQCDMLVRLGNTDFAQSGLTDLIADLRLLLMIGSSHIAHEEVHVHTALELRAPKGAKVLQEQHDSHRQAFRQLEEIIDRLEHAQAHERLAIGRQLYLSYSLFVAHDFAHMVEEETEHNALLWSLFEDGELRAIEGAIVGSIPPEKSIIFMRLMLPAINPAERAALLGGVKANAPKEAFIGLLEMAARPSLSANDFADLESRLADAA